MISIRLIYSLSYQWRPLILIDLQLPLYIKAFYDIIIIVGKTKGDEMNLKESTKVKEQHYVPEAYLKYWKTLIPNNQATSNDTKGVYVYEKNNIDSFKERTIKVIMKENHIYTIGNELFFLAIMHDKIHEDLSLKLFNCLKARKVYAIFKGKVINSLYQVKKNFITFSDWDYFEKGTNNVSSKKSIISQINDIKSYVLENAFDKYVENHYDKILKDFINAVVVSNMPGGIKRIDCQVAYRMLNMFVVMASRNPAFDGFGSYKYVDNLIDVPWSDENNKQILKKAIWLRDIYAILFCQQDSISTNMLDWMKNKGGMILYEPKDLKNSFFITSDKPAFVNLNCIFKENINGCIFALSPKYLLYIAKNSKENVNEVGYKLIEDDEVKRMNEMIRTNATKVIVSNRKDVRSVLN